MGMGTINFFFSLTFFILMRNATHNATFVFILQVMGVSDGDGGEDGMYVPLVEEKDRPTRKRVEVRACLRASFDAYVHMVHTCITQMCTSRLMASLLTRDSE